ncbi:MAG: UDP-glucose 4-epimerase GalE [Acidobacteria bacterium]|nr:UDP-glucose 4-epimerase GalE [Acidobacteriota bacterium]
MGAVLVTGGAGYIGSHTVKALRAAGRDVVVLDDLSLGHRAAVAGVPLVEAGISDAPVVRDTLRQHDVTAVMHFAASASVGESVADPHGYYVNNVVDTLVLLGALRDRSVRHLVFSSTAAVYGVPEETPIRENHPTRPVNPYGETKLAVERALPHYEHAYGLVAIRLRYFNAAGADPDGTIGEDHRPENHAIPRAIDAAQGGPRFDVYGADYPTPDGTCLRDYVHVSDLAHAHVLSLAALEAGRPARAYNVGTGRPHSVLDVLASVERVTGRPPARRVAARRSGDPPVLHASNARIRDELGWRPRFENLDAIVETAWRWRRAHPGGYAETAPES